MPASLNGSLMPRGGAYSRGFRSAGLLLAGQVCESGKEQDTLVYPIVYLYRHHAELVLKSIIECASAFLDRNLTKSERDSLGHHDLAKLWKIARPLLDLVCGLEKKPPLPSADMEGIDSYVRQLHEHDPDGQRFRYATAKTKRAGARKGSVSRGPSLSPELNVINIRAFAIAMEKLADYLEGIDRWVGGMREWQDDMRREKVIHPDLPGRV